MGKARAGKSGFTLVEILVYTGILAVTAGLLTAILSNTLRIRNREANSTEVAQQLAFVMENIQSLVAEAALVEEVYETGSPGTACTSFCTLKLRTSSTSTDPTFVHASSDGAGIYLTQGAASPNTNNPLTSSDVIVDHFILTKLVFEGGHDSVRIDMALTIDSSDPQLAVTRSIQSAIGRATAAEFDDHLLPGTDATYDVGQVSGSNRWRDGAFSRDVTIQGYLAIGSSSVSTRPLSIQESTSDWVEFKDSAGVAQWHFVETNAGDFDITETGVTNGNLYLQAGGNVGVGTTNPNSRLTVNGALSLAEGSAPSNTSSFGKLYVSSSDSLLHFVDDGGTSHPFFTDVKCIWLEDPVGTDDLKSIWTANGFGATLTKMWCESDATVNADLQVDDGTPADVNGTDLVCDNTPAEDESLTGDNTMTDGDRLDLAIASVSGSPTWVSMCWTFTYTE